MVAKTRGEFVWHSHPDTDDFFLVVEGALTIQLPGRATWSSGEGELFVVPRASSTARAPTRRRTSC